MRHVFTAALAALAALTCLPLRAAPPKAAAVIDPTRPVSYYQHVRPVFQAQCHGCHQPAKAKGGYIMTDHAALLKGGEEGVAVVPGKPDESHLLALITPKDGKAKMPKKADPLTSDQIALVRRWIQEGAVDDTPVTARQAHDAEHPPVYARAPVVTSLDFAPNTNLLAVAGFHEVLLHRADGSGLEARLIGLSERIQSVRFSPDGRKLAVAGGNPGRMGEVQVWDVATRRLELSVPRTFDTLYGASWSPDGTQIAYGGADNVLRAFSVSNGVETLFMGSSNDWVLDTVWSVKGTHVASAGRDMAAKLTEVATQRFVDNITSITPGALKGGLHALARHPARDELLVGGADGVPQIYRWFRETPRKIGDNANLVRKFPAMEGRIFAVDYAPDGSWIAAGSAYHGKGAVNLYAAAFDATLPGDIKGILSKETTGWNADERKKVEEWQTKDIALRHHVALPGGVMSLSVSPDGKFVAAGGEDGIIRLIDAGTGAVTREFPGVPVTPAAAETAAGEPARNPAPPLTGAEEKAPAVLNALRVEPAEIRIGKPNDTVQVLVTAELPDGTTADVTRLVKLEAQGVEMDITPRGQVRPRNDGKGTLRVSLGDKSATVPVELTGIRAPFRPDYVRDVMPVMSRLGCNAGACHGAKDGKNGFKLSLRGYDPPHDVIALTEELWGRRATVAAPDRSLMLLKSSGSVPHEGGGLTQPGERHYETLRAWLAHGAALDESTPRVTRIEVFPRDPVVQTIGQKQQFRVTATYADGAVRDVTADAFIETGNAEVLETDKHGLGTTVRRGEAPVLARFEGAYAATTVTVMGDRTGFTWQDPPAYNRIDELVAAKWKRMKIQPSEVCTDAEFIRRVTLDLTGLPPGPDDIRAFLADTTETRAKREALVDRLIGSEAFVEHWANKWADLLQVNGKFLGAEGAKLFRDWIRRQVADNIPYDRFVQGILTASGSNQDNPPAAYYKVLRTPEECVENTTHLFLATRFNCNKCHDHPFERWNMDHYYQTAAFFAQVTLSRDPASGDKNIGGTAVEGAKPLFEVVAEKGGGEVTHLRTGKPAAPTLPYPVSVPAREGASRREQLAAWMVSPENPLFASSYANRVWGYLTGTGIIEPIDDIRAGNPPSNPELLQHLTSEFTRNGFNVRHLMRIICTSRTYQLSVAANQWNADDHTNYSHAKARRLPAEVLYDALHAVTGSTSKIPGVPAGTRAAALADAQVKLPDGFLGNFGRPVRESACECERSNEVNLGPVMALVSGPTLGEAISDPNNAIARLVKEQNDDRRLIEELFLRVWGRSPTEPEAKAALQEMSVLGAEHKTLEAELAAKEAEQKPAIDKLEAERVERIAKAQAEHDAYKKESDARRAEAEKQREAALAAARKSADENRAASALRRTEWEQLADLSTEWTVLDAASLKAPDGITLEKQPDGSILAIQRKVAKGPYTIEVNTPLTGITGFKLEALPDPRLPHNGPGLNAGDGNFVLSEFEVAQAPQVVEKGKAGKVMLENALATFSQKDFPVTNAVNGKDGGGGGEGWAIHPELGRAQTAVFATKDAAGFEGGTKLTFTLKQNFSDGNWSLGKFRLSATTAARPLRVGVSAPLAAALRTPEDKRAPEQKTLVEEAFLTQDRAYQTLQVAVARANTPTPADPKLAELLARVEEAKKPITIDPVLAQLRRDTDLSRRQLENHRLTTAQDLTWALINSPAFLFNH